MVLLNIVMAILLIALGVCISFVSYAVYQSYKEHQFFKVRINRVLSDYPYLKGRVSRIENVLDGGNVKDEKE